MGGIWSLFDRAEQVISEDTKNAISRWLQNLDVAPSQTWVLTFISVFEYVFGRRHISFLCFFRSSIASLVSVISLTLLWCSVRPNQALSFFAGNILGNILSVIFFSFFFNTIPDYISLLETRYVLSLMKTTSSIVRTTAFLVLDFALTTTIITIVSLIILCSSGESISSAINLLLSGFLLSSNSSSLSLGVYVYSTYFTSVWIWLYVASGLIVRVLIGANFVIKMTRQLLDIKGQPLRSLGFVSMFIVTSIYVIIPFLR